MTSKEALWCLLSNQKPLKNQHTFTNLKTNETTTLEECVNMVLNSLDKLERYEKIIIPNFKKIVKKDVLNQEELNMVKAIKVNHKRCNEEWENIWGIARQQGVWIRRNNGDLYATQPITSINSVELCDLYFLKDSDSKVFDSKAPRIISETKLEEENYGITWALTKEELE